MRSRLGTTAGVIRHAVRLAALCLVALAAACLQPAAPAGPYPRFAEFAGREVQEVEFMGEVVVPEDSLRAVLATRATRCRLLVLPVCPFGFGRQRHHLDLTELARDVTRIQLFHRDHGYYGTRVVPAVEPVEGGEEVAVRFAILPGDRVTAQAVEVQGTEGIVPPRELERRLPLKEGDPFRRRGFLASADTVQSALFQRGYAYAQVLRNYAIDTIADVAEARFGAIPGPLVRVDTIIVLGNQRLPRETILRQIAVREGDVLVSSRLNQSQRNLYELGLINFASVQLAPDTLQVDPDSAQATVVVRVVEAPRYLAEASAGYGTLDCFRTQGRLVDRNFLGGARRLEVSGSLSKIGVGEPLDADLENRTLCKVLEENSLPGDSLNTLNVLNYRIAATFTQPRLFGTRTSTTLSLHAERISEFRTFLRASRGGQLAVAREVAPQTLVTATANVERGRTNASDVFFCVTLTFCTPEQIDPLRESRWSNWTSVAAVRDRTRYNVYPVGGYQARASVDWASALLGSDDRYLRLFGDGAAYRQVRPRWVLAGRLMAGTFLEGIFEEQGFIPPERRFYAGGPNSVRGLERNALGPTLYITEQMAAPGDSAFDPDDVDIAATGGTRMVVGSLELRMPSPFLSHSLRLATFVDAGAVWAGDPRTDPDEPLTTRAELAITPGIGARYMSPVGPIRVDLGFKTTGPGTGPLFGFSQETGRLRLLAEEFERPTPEGFLERFQLYIAVGQAF